MIIASYYINRSYRFSPCWDVATSLQEAINKAQRWAKESKCYVSITTTENKKEKKIIVFDEKGQQIQ